MYETDRIPTDWKDNCNQEVPKNTKKRKTLQYQCDLFLFHSIYLQVEEIWVPTNFNVETFAKNGVNRTKLFQVYSFYYFATLVLFPRSYCGKESDRRVG